jgi:hypothetical protein
LELAEKVNLSRVTVTGVQPKLSLDIEPAENSTEPKRGFPRVGLMGWLTLYKPAN